LPLTHSWELQPGLLRVVATGPFTIEEARAGFLLVLDAVARHQVDRVLYDGSQITGFVKGHERFVYGKFVAEALATHVKRGRFKAPRFAYVLIEPIGDPQRLGEMTATNRGMDVRTFVDLDSALRWLERPSEPDLVNAT
jgi:hypothetical protein